MIKQIGKRSETVCTFKEFRSIRFIMSVYPKRINSKTNQNYKEMNANLKEQLFARQSGNFMAKTLQPSTLQGLKEVLESRPKRELDERTKMKIQVFKNLEKIIEMKKMTVKRSADKRRIESVIVSVAGFPVPFKPIVNYDGKLEMISLSENGFFKGVRFWGNELFGHHVNFVAKNFEVC